MGFIRKRLLIVIIPLIFLGFFKTVSADFKQLDSSYITPTVSNIYQSLGNGLLGTVTNITLKGSSPYWWNNILQFALLVCDSEPVGFDVSFSNFGCSYATGNFVVRPDQAGYINQPTNITFDPLKYYAIFFYQDWQIYGSTTTDSYPNGSIGSVGSPNNNDNVGDLRQVYFHLAGIPVLSQLGQFKSDGTTAIPEGASTTESKVVFKAIVNDPDNNSVKLQLEIRQINQLFTGIDDGGISNSEFVASDSEIILTRQNLAPRKYYWRMRAVDENGNASAWQEFGQMGNVDFAVGDWTSSLEVFQGDFSYAPPYPSSNVYQSLGNGLSGTATSIVLKGASPAWHGFLQFEIFECNTNPVGFDTESSTFGCGAITPTFVVRPDASGYINQSLNITFNPDKYYSIFFYQDWQIYGSTDFDSYINGSIGSFGSPNSHDDVGELKQTYFHLVGVNLSLPSTKRDPVIIVPGILGSWWKKVLPDLSAGELVLDPILHTYDDLYNALAQNGYVPEQTLFAFPYDWRSDNRLTAVALRDKISEIKSVCECQKVDIIAHSMGGLVSRYYIESNLYEDDIDQLILLGTPNKGAPKSYLTWEAGENSPPSTVSDEIEVLLKILSKVEGFGADRFEYIRNKPITSIKQLLPTYNYLKDSNSGDLSTYPSGYPENVFLGGSDDEFGLNSSSGLAKLEQGGVRIINIAGDNLADNTVNTIRVVNDISKSPLWGNGYPDKYDTPFGDQGLELGRGDATVPLISAQSLNLSNVQQIVINSDHLGLPTNAFDEILDSLTGNSVASIESTSLVKSILIIPVFSPVDIQVIDPLGRRVGRDFSTGQDINEIPLSYYTGSENLGMEFITIPNPIDGEYQIKTKGTGSGSYEIQSIFISDVTSTTASFTADTEPGLKENLSFNFSSSTPESTSIIPEDTTPPTTTILLSGTLGENNWFISDIAVSLSTEDNQDGVGVFKTEYSMDDGQTWNGYAAPLLIVDEGTYIILYRSEDFVGNIEGTKSAEIKIDKTPPEAKLYFDKDKRNLKVESVDNLSQTQVSQFDNTFIVEDEASHTLKIEFEKLKQEGKEIKAKLQTLQYDYGSIIEVPKTELKFEWSVDKKNDMIRELKQKVDVAGQFKGEVKYHQNKNRTNIKIVVEVGNNELKIEKEIAGFVFIKLITESGSLNYEF